MFSRVKPCCDLSGCGRPRSCKHRKSLRCCTAPGFCCLSVLVISWYAVISWWCWQASGSDQLRPQRCWLWDVVSFDACNLELILPGRGGSTTPGCDWRKLAKATMLWENVQSWVWIQLDHDLKKGFQLISINFNWCQLVSIDFNLLSIDFPFDSFKKSIEKKEFRLISIYFQVILLLKPSRIQLKKKSLLSTDFPFKQERKWWKESYDKHTSIHVNLLPNP